MESGFLDFSVINPSSYQILDEVYVNIIQRCDRNSVFYNHRQIDLD